MTVVVDILGVIALAGCFVVFGLILVGWHARGWRGNTAWDPYHDGIEEVRQWFTGRRAKRDR
jgi:hypothetical protein